MPIVSQFLRCLSVFYYVMLEPGLGKLHFPDSLVSWLIVRFWQQEALGKGWKAGVEDREVPSSCPCSYQCYSRSSSWLWYNLSFAAPRTKYLELSPRGVDISPVGPFLWVPRSWGPHFNSFVPLTIQVSCFLQLQISGLSQCSHCDLSAFQHLCTNSLY